MKIKYISFTGMHNRDGNYPINDVTYFYGKNGAGKTTILEAIQLALLGYVPSTGKTKQSVIQHARKNNISVRCVLDDNGTDVTVSRTFVDTGKGVTSSLVVDPESYNIENIVSELELPIFNFNEFINMSANTLKDWFINFLPKSDSEINWEQELKSCLATIGIPEEKVDLTDALSTVRDFNTSGVETVRLFNNWLKSQLTANKAEFQRIESTVQQLIHYDDIDASIGSDEVSARIDEFSKLRDAYLRYQSMCESNDKAKAAMEALPAYASKGTDNNQRYIDLCYAIQEACHGIDKDRKAISDIDNEIESHRRAYTKHLDIFEHGTVCPYSNAECEHMSSAAVEAQAGMNEAEAAIASLKSKREKIEEAIAVLETSKTEMNEEIKKIGEACREYSYWSSKIVPVPDTVTECDIDFVDSEIARLQDQLVKIKANERYSELVDSFVADKFRIATYIDALNAWIKHTGPNGLQNKLMLEPFTNLSKNLSEIVTAMFGPNVEVKFNLSEKANSFNFGLIKKGATEYDSVYVPYDLLSSGEKCMFALMLMAYIASNCNSDLKVVMVDDLLDHLDTDNAITVFDSLAETKDIQFIMAGVKPCGSRPEIVINIE